MTIEKMFSSISHRYDLCNDLMSLRLHRRWNRKLIQELLITHQPKNYLDLCCGTGDIPFTYLDISRGRFPPPHQIYLLDFSSEMLNLARNKSKSHLLDHHNLIYLQANAETIPLQDQSIDCVSIAYGIRNVPNSQKCFSDVFRILKPGGHFGILELSKPKNPWIGAAHKIYLRTWIQGIGKMISPNASAYRYLKETIEKFTPPLELKNQLQKIGFSKIKIQPLLGGVATIITAKKP